MKRYSFFKKQENHKSTDFTDVLEHLQKSKDFTSFTLDFENEIYCVSFFDTLIDKDIMHRDLLPFLHTNSSTLEELVHNLPIEGLVFTKNPAELQSQLLMGYIAITLNNQSDQAVLVKAANNTSRQVTLPEVEFSVVGPKEALVESLDTNLYLIRKRLPIAELAVEEIIVGKLSKTRVAVIHIEGIANSENVETVIQRISDLRVNQIIDSSYISQMIEDNKNSPFPQFIDTERPDRLAAVLGEGKVVILVDGAPHGLLGPSTFFEYFAAFEDYFLNWTIASFFRLIRFFAVLFSILMTPIYVAVLTYHYELIPKDLVSTLVISRSGIPFPPILEALILELAIELLREAGARLPTKVGQTIGIVGGIVIGTASVEAGLTSNVLLILVALSALGSFTTPVYQMGNTIRLIRFPLLLMAYFLGLLGIAISFCFLLVHLLRITSLGRPFLEPLYPPRIYDMRDALIRLPFFLQAKRPIEVQTEDTVRLEPKEDSKE
ncbi:spore germination protein [Peribacillus castrilensis]|uniref:Sopre germination protein n=1 Tax=Peribacillus simplex TaxID=1478 RepID=A0AAN2PL69_9BACI|nr:MULTISPECIES: spore germination protein [Bacillaceae]MCP1094732.1 spore germination protein [Bacillaceae bacterium OS4b]MBD8588848.1 spore germination protein [Peribacillus simplex]MCF7624582.1 spore germination protein [Peribacillus frigoritolerans]MCP1155122.1 spore germination protein [Peribacillus frigoritolerans]MCT1391091.1 spore germination protein [Peribacillus frigoritolerans]